jgi:ribonuclease HI
MKPKVEIFTDGSCPVPGSYGGWAYIMRIKGAEKRRAGGLESTTNNRAELMGPIKALEDLVFVGKSLDIILTSDSQYVTKGISEWLSKWVRAGWKKRNYKTKELEDVANKDLWKRLYTLILEHDIKTSWVRGHTGHQENEWCDTAAGAETKKMILENKNEI